MRNLYEVGCGHEFRERIEHDLLDRGRGGGMGTTLGTSRLRNSASTASLYHRSLGAQEPPLLLGDADQGEDRGERLLSSRQHLKDFTD